ncbi:MAG: alpha-glucan family phosphorylase [Steroidobacteraceae bacterium]
MKSEHQDTLASLRQLALDLRWSWNHAADEVWRRLEPDLWSRTHNPWVVLQTVSRKRLAELLTDSTLREKIEGLEERRRDAVAAPAWFHQTHAGADLKRIAYFSMEFMLSEALPIYAGGLGNVAGDQLKAASDLAVPVIGLGLLYQQGYFRQLIGRDGEQQALFPYNDPGQLPVTPLRQADGEWLRIALAFPGGPLWVRAWQVQVGRLHLYLLDSNDAANLPLYRGITSELYGGGAELRLQQEIILGIGGWRLLAALGVAPEVCHLNEGHAALAVLERARCFMKESGQPFDTSLAVTRAGNLFTTHTAVSAGFDRFAPELIEQYLGQYARAELGVPLARLLALGRANARDDGEAFNMAYLALRASGAVNGVSRVHGEVSRAIFAPLFPRWPLPEVPVGHVTNGIHTPSWDSPEADALWTSACGKDRWKGDLKEVEKAVRRVSDVALWRLRATARRALVEFTRERLSWQLTTSGAGAEASAQAMQVFDPEALTLGFARRFATYKRPNLLLHDAERLVRILTRKDRPVQLVIAGKAHPADGPGQALIREWVQFVRRPDVRLRAAFLSDYDMLLTEHLVQGVDVWINTPRRPWEACGTSGMKVLVNGGLNLSELDGWWAEAYGADVGWALGDGKEHGEDRAWDALEASRLYELLERQIIPEFYARNDQGVPQAWITRMRESMARLTPQFSANRNVREYVEGCYLPAARAYRRRAGGGGAAGSGIVKRLQALEEGWPTLRFGRFITETREGGHRFTAEVYRGALDSGAFRVELYAEPLERSPASCIVMARDEGLSGTAGMDIYHAAVAAERSISDYTARIIPADAEFAVPLEAPYILWER